MRKGVFMHITIQTVINNVWFHNRNADGVILQDDYCKSNMGVSPFMIALVSAAVSVLSELMYSVSLKITRSDAALMNGQPVNARPYSSLPRCIEINIMRIATYSPLSKLRRMVPVRKLCIKIMKDALYVFFLFIVRVLVLTEISPKETCRN